VPIFLLYTNLDLIIGFNSATKNPAKILRDFFVLYYAYYYVFCVDFKSEYSIK